MHTRTVFPPLDRTQRAPPAGEPGVPRGRVVSCGACGYVFLGRARLTTCCRRCGAEGVEPYRAATI